MPIATLLRAAGAAVLISLAVLANGPGSLLEAQSTETVEIVANPRYDAGSLHERVLGHDYRDLWNTPIEVPLLDLDSFAGGLTVVERGGGQQTRALRFLGADGHEYNFRSVDKWVTPDPRADIEDTPLEALVQDQVSSLHPAAAIVATGLLNEVGILNPGPRMVVLPDDPRLGEFREEFAGMLGTIEAHANESADGSSVFADADEVESEADFFAEIRESPENQVDASALLAERLMSLLLGDWDRHAGQYRWARFDSAGVHVWTPVPEDRDYAFVDYDGLAFNIVGGFISQLSPYVETYPSSLYGLIQNAIEVDRRLLTELSWPVWEETARRLQAELTDEAIERSVRLMPEPYFRASGEELIRILRARRDRLDEVARRFYLVLAAEPGIHATDAAEQADIERLQDGSVRVTVSAASETSTPGPFFDRTFLPGETREIRLFLYGGDDRAVVHGTVADGPLVRVIGGAGADTLRDRSSVSGRSVHTAFHDDEGENVIATGTEAVVDPAPYDPPPWVPGEILPPRDWGAKRSWFSPWAAWEHTQGVMLGGGPSWTWYGFRRFPVAGRAQLVGMWGVETGRVGMDGEAEFSGIGSAPDVWLHGRASQLEDFRFHGFGNESPEEGEVPGEVLLLDQLLVEARLRYRLADRLRLGFGPVFERIKPRPTASALGRLPEGSGDAYGKAGLAGELSVDAGGDEAMPRGVSLEIEGRYFPEAWDLEAPFGRVGGVAAAYLPLPARSLLAVRAGGAQLWGEAPLPELVSLGGSATLRGFSYQRFTGDAMVHASAELRTVLTRAELFVRGDLGVLAFMDVGRVYLDGESAGGWHEGYGAGLWFRSVGQVASITYAQGEEDSRVYLKLGFPW